MVYKYVRTSGWMVFMVKTDNTAYPAWQGPEPSWGLAKIETLRPWSESHNFDQLAEPFC